MTEPEAPLLPRGGGGRRKQVAPRRRLSGCLPLLLVLVVIGVAGYVGLSRGVDWLDDRFGDPDDFPGPGDGVVTFEVAEGDSLSRMGRNLADDGVVASVEAFTAAAAENPDAAGIQEGFYRLQEKLPAADVVDLLVSGETRGTAYNFTPGKTVDEIVALLARDTELPRSAFRKALAEPEKLGLPDDAEGNAEGYLYPGRYVIFADSTARSILRDMVAAWQAEAEDLNLATRAERLGYTEHEMMTIASMIQAEGSLLGLEGKSKIARVIYNRLEIEPNPSAGFLQLDATVDFARGERTARLTIAEIDEVADSPYNTYRTKGLPPGPIATPGAEALEAALEPADGDWFWYVTVNLRTGETKFASTDDEFAALVAEFDEYCATQSDAC